ncbi:UDP-2-acetamido-2,6-beta-L-arabino-hexul-4-ose reductase [Leptospira interrogans]|uniref:NAD dependent epimerase/dehydratase family protein n=2 Tax=Leptospira interrogans TaxID=173 RepID=A0A0F6IJ14_LEPIR|nr:NAD-dependent epimerase/dehydratase family protein [Leptospira interrogans]ADC94136.1 nucleoside-diphosphate-sugar epimerase [Leptospira interrogans serovar Hebdomadis]EKR34137.1 NAD dependent epimerase/dehydratase family protein [Leptospira interrogans serovar Hebdomadis str. R499]EKR81405.1 NAD dependent epimerase/dehydratase family protein [Leptospira interrogans str. UI 08452]EMJ38039.1 NAD dependent epimerase/dehydratase family protein [Leptospira interrogans str. FPW1039]EMN37625.1 NA
MNVLITGANGFIGKNLTSQLIEKKEFKILSYTKESTEEELSQFISEADFIFHLAGVNRPKEPLEFKTVNTDLTGSICNLLKKKKKKTPILFSSSIQATMDNEYGKSKLEAEHILEGLQSENGNPVFILRLPNVFGKWSRPNYNSVVATFCYNIIRDLPVKVNNPDVKLTLAYIDDVIDEFLSILRNLPQDYDSNIISYEITLNRLYEMVCSFKRSRQDLTIPNVGTGLMRALYATYTSYLDTNSFSYSIPQYKDPRGVFVEMLKTQDSGQFSFFTAHPGITRGEHYHHSKIEKFFVITGKAKFRFRNILTNEYFEVFTEGNFSQVVESIPGWTHDITNVGKDEMVVMLWASEIFDRSKPDTYSCKIDS